MYRVAGRRILVESRSEERRTQRMEGVRNTGAKRLDSDPFSLVTIVF